jgi:hypothetical protein
VDPDVTPASLVGLHETTISSEAEKLIAPSLGKWIRVSGPRGSTVPRRRGVTLLRFDRRPGSPLTRLEMRFRETDARDHLEAIPRGTEIVVVGKIASVTRAQMILDDCVVEEANPRSPARL